MIECRSFNSQSTEPSPITRALRCEDVWLYVRRNLARTYVKIDKRILGYKELKGIRAEVHLKKASVMFQEMDQQ